jgi:hypothetical protein
MHSAFLLALTVPLSGAAALKVKNERLAATHNGILIGCIS